MGGATPEGHEPLTPAVFHVLLALSDGPLHGYGVARWLEDATGQGIQVDESSLYPALYRLEKKGLLASEWGRSELDRRAKFYRLTPVGSRELRKQIDEWASFSAAVSSVLLPDEAG